MLPNPAKLIINDCHWSGDPKIVSASEQAISELRLDLYAFATPSTVPEGIADERAKLRS